MAPAHQPTPQTIASVHPPSVATHHPRHRRRSNNGLIVSFCCGLGLLAAGVLGFVLLGSDRTTDHFAEEPIASTPQDDSFVELERPPTEDAEPGPPSESPEVDSEAPQTDRTATDTKTQPEPTTNRVGPVRSKATKVAPIQILRRALMVWNRGNSVERYLAATPSVRSIDLPDWQHRRYKLAKWKTREVKGYRTGPEQRFHVDLEFENPGVAPVTYTIAVRRIGDESWSIALVTSW